MKWYRVNRSASDCFGGGTGNIDLKQNNGWIVGGPDSANCSGTGDQTAIEPFAQTEAWYAASDDNYVDIVTFDDFLISAGSSYAGSGTAPVSVPAWVSTVLNDASWPEIRGGNLSDCGPGMPTDLNQDANCVPRTAVNMGALETTQ